MPDLSIGLLLVILISALLTGVLHGATGMAGGIVMAAILANLMGIKVAIPVMTCALIFSHFSRVVMYRRNADFAIAKRVLIFGIPSIILGAVIFGYLSPRIVAIVFAVFLSLSIPIRYWARKHNITTSPELLAGASAVWGVLAGNVIGPGFFLAPFLLGTGMGRLAFVGTTAVITLVMNIVKLAVFSGTELMTWPLFLLGSMIGIATIPGNWLGRALLKRMGDHHHRFAVDVLTILVVINIAYLAISNKA